MTASEAPLENKLKTAKNSWLLSLSYAVFSGITLLGVDDSDFFLEAKQTKLPVIEISIPTAEFFFFGSIVGLALHIYAMYHLINYWRQWGDTEYASDSIGAKEFKSGWLIGDLTQLLNRDINRSRIPLWWLSLGTTFASVFLLMPFILGSFWVRYWPAHREWESLAMAGLTAIGLLASILGLLSVLSFPNKKNITPIFDRSWKEACLFLLIFLFLASISWLKTEGLDQTEKGDSAKYELGFISVPGWLAGLHVVNEQIPNDELGRWRRPILALAQADLSGVNFSQLPDNWLPPKQLVRKFRLEWCSRSGLPPNVCGSPDAVLSNLRQIHSGARLQWCEASGLGRKTDCNEHFDALEADFLVKWDLEWENRVSQVRAPNLSREDLRDAIINEAVLVGANLRHARLDRALIIDTNLDGADLSFSRATNANFGGSSLYGARMFEVEAVDAIFSEVDLEQSIIWQSQFTSSKFDDANLSRALIISSDFSGTDFLGAAIGPAVVMASYFESAENLTPEQFSSASAIPLKGDWLGLSGIVDPGFEPIRWCWSGSEMRYFPAAARGFTRFFDIREEGLRELLACR